MPSTPGDEPVAIARLVLACSLLGCASAPPAAAAAPVAARAPDQLECTYSYGGETKTVRVGATVEPYRAPSISVGDRFLLKFVYVKEPPDVASVRAYTYLATEAAPLPISEVKYRPPFPENGEFGFTGRASVYDARGHELTYFCAWVKR